MIHPSTQLATQSNMPPQPSDQPSLATATIPSNYARIIGRELGLNVRDIPKLLQFTQLSTQQFMQEDTLLNAEQLIQILHNGMHLSEHLDFGLRLGKRLTPSTHGAMGFLANSSPNLLIALQAFQAFLPTRISFARLTLQQIENSIQCSLKFDIELPTSVHRVLSETCGVIFYECAAFIIGRQLTEASICFSHDQPTYSYCYPNYLAGPYSFNAPELSVSIPLAMCEIPNASANHENYILAMRQCELMLAQLQPQKHRYIYQIQKVMLSHPLSELSEENVAAALFISKRTLARRLKEDGMSFREIKDTILSKQASSYLLETELSVDAIASLLDYHDSANFRRAFKRWFNMAPNTYRQQSLK